MSTHNEQSSKSLDSELLVKVVDMEDITSVDRLEGYTSGVRSATWHPDGSLLVRFLDF